MAHMLEMGARRRRPARGRCRVVSLLATSATLLLGIGLLPQTLEVGFAEGTLSSLRVSPLPSMNACHHGAPARTCMRAKPKPGPRKDTKAQTDALDERKKKDDVIEIEGTVLMHSRNIFKVELTNGCEVRTALLHAGIVAGSCAISHCVAKVCEKPSLDPLEIPPASVS
eukprot:TRINITY_DN5414_c0_g1_i2.p1 TRINITY_DN5414_c0_g1~~TRINITY_DN5414_c0_g1_i2.p1  ORF type:complete len:169 (-),score=21.09 TRINITY_DN5414_c0_g1_i2:200-706(-)